MVCPRVLVNLLAASIIAAAVLGVVTAAPLDRELQSVPDYDDPEYVLALVNRFLRSHALENSLRSLVHPNGGTNKRGLDLGLGRGFSGSMAAKHLMGLNAANFANGPGRRKRQASDDGDQDTFAGGSLVR